MNYSFGLFRPFFLVLFFLFRGGIVFAKQPIHDSTKIKQIFAKAKAYHKQDLVEMQWDCIRYNTTSTDTSKYSYSYIQNKIKDTFIFSRTSWALPKYSDKGVYYASFSDTNVSLLLNSPNYKVSPCVLPRSKSYIQEYFNPEIPWFTTVFAKDFKWNTSLYSLLLEQTKEEIKIVLEHKKHKKKITLEFFADGRYKNYKEEEYWMVRGVEVVQVKSFYNFSYSRKNSLPSLNASACIEIPIFGSIEYRRKSDTSHLDSFLYKKFSSGFLRPYVSPAQLYNSNKITLLDYTWFMTHEHLQGVQVFSRLMDSFPNELQVILIDAGSEKKYSESFAKQVLAQNLLEGKVSCYFLGKNGNTTQKSTLRWAITSFPTFFLLDKQGVVQYIHTEKLEDEEVFNFFYEKIKSLR
jgi:hypothetical protein